MLANLVALVNLVRLVIASNRQRSKVHKNIEFFTKLKKKLIKRNFVIKISFFFTYKRKINKKKSKICIDYVHVYIYMLNSSFYVYSSTKMNPDSIH